MKLLLVDVVTGSKDKYIGYLAKLYNALCRNTTVPFTVEIMRQSKYPPVWAKMELFNQDEPIVFVDLDMVVTGNCDFLFEYTGNFCVTTDCFFPKRYSTEIMHIKPGVARVVWEQFLKDGPEKVMKSFKSDQNYLDIFPGIAERWQDGLIKSYKAHKLTDGPQGARLCHFHGVPKPADMPKGHWIEEYWR